MLRSTVVTQRLVMGIADPVLLMRLNIGWLRPWLCNLLDRRGMLWAVEYDLSGGVRRLSPISSYGRNWLTTKERAGRQAVAVTVRSCYKP